MTTEIYWELYLVQLEKGTEVAMSVLKIPECGRKIIKDRKVCVPTALGDPAWTLGGWTRWAQEVFSNLYSSIWIYTPYVDFAAEEPLNPYRVERTSAILWFCYFFYLLVKIQGIKIALK